MKKNKTYSPVEIDFDTGECSETFESKLSYVCNRVRGIRNPYVGNKSKILYNIINLINEEGIEYNSVLDLFSGSAYLSLAMKLLGKRVVSNDLLHSSYIYAHAFVENNKEIITKDESDFLLNNVVNDTGFRMYHRDGKENVDAFTESELRFLFDYRSNVRYLFAGQPDSPHPYNPYKLSLAFVCLQLYMMQRVFVGGRLYKGQVIARLDHRLNHQRNQGQEMNFKNIRWLNFNMTDDLNQHRSYREDAYFLVSSKTELIKDCELVYIDPPYGGEQSDYFNMYDFFNFYCSSCEDKDYFEQSNDGRKKFTRSSDYEKNFVELLDVLHEVNIPNWVISYNDSSWAGVDTIKKIVSKFKKKVKVYDLDYDYKYRNAEKSSGMEYIIIAR